MSSACCSAIGSVVPIWTGGGGGGGGAVLSVFGRVGVVMAVAGDYTSTLITNASGVAGATVSAALDQLNADKVPVTRTLTAGAGLTGGGDLSANRTFDAVANADGSIVVNPDDIQVGVLATDAQHGARGGGTQHADATILVSGFFTPAEKIKLASLPSGPIVNSVFGRTGVVVAVAGDYDSDEVDNASAVPGATVSDALDALASTSGVTSVFGRTGAVTAVLGDYSTDLITESNAIPAGSITLTAALLGNPTAIDIYINPTTGNDANVGSSGSPIATIAEAVRRLMLYQRIKVGFPVMFHLNHGPHVWTPIPFLQTGAALGIYADPVFDSTVRTTATSGTSQAGTGQGVIVTTGGLTIDAHIKQWIVMTSGAANGQIRSISSNTATNIIPLELFSSVPAPGDTYTVFTTNCSITAPAVNGPVYSPFCFGTEMAFPRYRAAGGIVLIGLTLLPAPNNFYSFGQGNYEFYGCRFITGNGFVTDTSFVAMGTPLGSGVGAQALVTQFFPGLGGNFNGYGNVSFSVGFGGCVPERSTKISGYGSMDLATFGVGVDQADVVVRCSTLSVLGGRNVAVAGTLTYVSGTRPQVQVTSPTNGQGGQLSLANCALTDSDTGPLVRVQNGSTLVLNSTVTGANGGAGLSLLCRYGARVLFTGAPALGGAGDDYDIEDGAPFNKAFFAVAGNRKFYLGNLMLRIS